jgi:hypothetical protein
LADCVSKADSTLAFIMEEFFRDFEKS